MTSLGDGTHPLVAMIAHRIPHARRDQVVIRAVCTAPGFIRAKRYESAIVWVQLLWSCSN